jgi:RNA polymerase sigma factor (sigma-70 family)
MSTDESLARDALRRAYETHRLPLLRLSTLLTGSPELAEDLVQDVFLRVATKIGALGPDEVRRYLRRSLLNAWSNELRHRQVESRAASKIGLDDRAPDSLPEEHGAMWPQILALPPRQRACVVLRYYEELSDREIASVLGCRVTTVRSQTSRAIRKLKEATAT